MHGGFTHVEIVGQHSEVNSLFPECGSWGSNVSHPSGLEVSTSPAEPSCQPSVFIFAPKDLVQGQETDVAHFLQKELQQGQREHASQKHSKILIFHSPTCLSSLQKLPYLHA